MARIRYEGGLTSETAFRQAQVELARTATLVPDLERQITLKENDIAFLTGDYPHHIKRTVLPEDVLLPLSLPVGLPSSLLERRPDVRQAEQALIAANAEVGIAFTSLFPSLTLNASYGGESDVLDELLKSPWHLLSANLLQPVFSKSTLDLAQLQYLNGVIGYMDLLDAQRGYLDAQIGLSNAVRDKQITMVNLYKALGGGWKE